MALSPEYQEREASFQDRPHDVTIDRATLEKLIESLKLWQSAQPVAPHEGGKQGGKQQLPPLQPVAQLLTDDEILTIAHRKATRYTHAVAPGQVTYGFSVAHLLDFVRAVLEEKTAQPVAQPLPDPCHTCAHYQQGKLPGVRIHDETCYECRSYWGNKWEAA